MARRLSGLALALLLACVTESPAQELQLSRGPFAVDVSLVASKRLATAREFLVAGDWDAAIEGLRLLSTELGDALVETGPGRCLNVRDACTALLSTMSAPGLARYRRLVDPEMDALCSAGRETRDPDIMRRIVREGFVSSSGDDALEWLAEWEWGQGRLDAAREYWTALVPLRAPAGATAPLVMRYPDAQHSLAEIHARLILCSIMQRDDRRAAAELRAFRELHPDAGGTLCGREGRYVDILAAVIEESRAWGPSTHPTAESTLGGSPRRTAVGSGQPLIEAQLWQRELPSGALPLMEPSRPALDGPGPLSTFPLTWHDLVVVSHAHSVRVLRLRDGTPAWPTGRPDDRGVVYSTATADVGPDLPAAGVPRYSATIADGRCFARLGLPIVAAGTRSLRRHEAPLICLDLEQGQGRLVWSIRPGDVFAADWTFTGAPLVVGDRVFVAIRCPTPQIEIGLACLDAGTGSLIWQRRICAALREAPAAYHLIDHELLTGANGLIFHATGAGAVAAVEADSGRLRWIATYASHSASLAAMSDDARWGLLPPVYDGGRLFVAANDTPDLMALDAASGVVLWKRPAPGPIVHLPGVVDGTLIAAGDQLWGIDVATGEVGWRVGYDDPAGYGYGRGALAGGRVYWTTHEDLWVVEAATGIIERRIPLPLAAGCSGGNLVIAGDMLLIARPGGLDAFGPLPSQEK
jgi:outer membrane protein assembly factor BamB